MRKLILLLLLAIPTVQAHEFQGAQCRAPERPINDQDDALWQQFLAEIDEFRACTQDKMEWHQSAVIAHQQDAKLAVEQWNSFVRTRLNAPQDFPWPPEEKR